MQAVEILSHLTDDVMFGRPSIRFPAKLSWSADSESKLFPRLSSTSTCFWNPEMFFASTTCVVNSPTSFCFKKITERRTKEIPTNNFKHSPSLNLILLYNSFHQISFLSFWLGSRFTSGILLRYTFIFCILVWNIIFFPFL